MRIDSLRFEDPVAGWAAPKVGFYPDVTLLVGLSGVGKTRILDTLMRLKRLSNGKGSRKCWGIKWSLQFIQNERHYSWEGVLENANGVPDKLGGELLFESDDENAAKPKFENETLSVNGRVIVKRQKSKITLNGKATPKLSQEESIIYTLRNEDDIGPAHHALNSILFVGNAEEPSGGRGFISFGPAYDPMKNKLTTIEAIRNEDIPTRLKLALAHENCRDVFNDISQQFKDAFPFVSEISVEIIDAGPFGKVPRIFLREQGIDRVIPEDAMSSGMYRTLMHLSRMALWPDGTLVLVDEFENSFGINCIGFVTRDLVLQSQRMQFILTSHHPYIINNIRMSNWKIVTRDGGDVKLLGPEVLDSDSSHEGFLKLLNLPQYSEGIATE